MATRLAAGPRSATEHSNPVFQPLPRVFLHAKITNILFYSSPSPRSLHPHVCTAGRGRDRIGRHIQGQRSISPGKLLYFPTPTLSTPLPVSSSCHHYSVIVFIYYSQAVFTVSLLSPSFSHPSLNNTRTTSTRGVRP